jgi:hypothetical protein
MKTNDNGVNRDMTADEIDAYNDFMQTQAAEIQEQAAAQAAKAAARQTVLDKLGLTADEAAALLG